MNPTGGVRAGQLCGIEAGCEGCDFLLVTRQFSLCLTGFRPDSYVVIRGTGSKPLTIRCGDDFCWRLGVTCRVHRWFGKIPQTNQAVIAGAEELLTAGMESDCLQRSLMSGKTALRRAVGETDQ